MSTNPMPSIDDLESRFNAWKDVPTRQDVIDRIERLRVERGAAYQAEEERIERELAALQVQCGVHGHLYKKNPWNRHAKRACLFCDAPEPQ